MNVLHEVEQLMLAVGARRYGAEPVSQLDHALQSAALAEADGATPALITAALLHDVGHVVDERFEGAAERGADRRHEDIGAGWLSRWFGPEVTEPVRLHVPAKRYLCAADAAYAASLSAASVRSLELQGGVFDQQAAAHFIDTAHAADAVRLRRYDDLAKVPGAPTLDLAHFLDIAARVLRAG